MFQEHSFFSQPIIFFGTNEIEEEDETEDPFSESLRISLDPYFSIQQQPRIELVFHWYSLDES